MANEISMVSLLSVIMAIVAIYLVFSIFNKVYREDYRKPWLFIGISAIFLALSEFLRFMAGYFNLYFVNSAVTQVVLYFLVFISLSFLTYGLLLEHLILKYYKGKFVKMKFIPVQEGTLGGELDINVTRGKTYLAVKRNRKFLIEQFSQAVKKGFEGFLLTEDNPKDTRTNFGIQKTPIAWVTQIDPNLSSDYVKSSLDENSDIVDPLQVNNMINYIDNFLEQSASPFVVLELNQIYRMNSFSILLEFLKYFVSHISKYNGIAIVMVTEDLLSKNEINEFLEFMLELE